MQNENNTAALTKAIESFTNMTFGMLNKLTGDTLTPAAHGARLLLLNDGLDFDDVREDLLAALRLIEDALADLKTVTPAAPVVDPTPTPEAAAPAAAPVAGVDAATVAALVREQVAALVKAEFASMDLVKVAGEAALAAFEAADLDYEGLVTNNVDLREIVRDAVADNLDLDDVAREIVQDALDNAVDLDDLACDMIKDKIEDDFSVDADEVAREIIEEKIDNDFSLDVDDVAREIVEKKVDDDLNLTALAGEVILDHLRNKPLTVSFKG